MICDQGSKNERNACNTNKKNSGGLGADKTKGI
jgi:hypothetical protein